MECKLQQQTKNYANSYNYFLDTDFDYFLYLYRVWYNIIPAGKNQAYTGLE